MTDVARFQRVEELFHEAVGVPIETRESFLVERCAGDAALLAEMRRLLALDDPTVAAPEPAGGRLPRFGAFQAERVLGRGGMGVVYLARRQDGQFDQLAAVKVIAPEVELDVDNRAFLRERRILASLQHHLIAQVIDGGVSDEGPYLVMEYVDGRPFDVYCNEGRLNIAARLGLARDICEAISHAHRNLIIHRDLKPSNVLVSAGGHLKLVDFGTAKMIAAVDSGATQNLATPRYASPEQLRGQPVGTATDIYSLGVILFESLTGAWPFGNPESRLDTARRAIEDVEPLALADAASEAHAACCGTTLRQLKRALSGDIADVVGKALDPDPDRRYRSADELSEDIGRHLAGRPVRARGASLWYRAERFARRRFWYLAAAGLSAAVLMMATVVSYAYARQSQRETERARRIAQFATQTLLSATPAYYTPMSGHTRPITIEDLLDNAADRAGQDLGADPAAEAEIRETLGETWAVLGNNAKAMPQLEAALVKLPKTAPGLENQRARLLLVLCNAVSFQGNYVRARTLCNDGLAQLAKAREPDTNLLFSGPFDFAYMSAKDGAPPAEVERLYRQSADAAARSFGANDRRYLIAMTRVGIARFDAGDLDEAARILTTIVAGLASLSGPPVELVIADRALAAVYRVQGALASAEKQASDGLALLDRRPAPFIDRYLVEQELWLDQALEGHADTVAGWSERVVGEVLSKLPPGHVDRAHLEVMGGRIMTLAGRCRQAEPLLRDAIDVDRSRLPLWPATRADALAALAECLVCEERPADARQAATEALRLYGEGFGAKAAGHPAVAAMSRLIADGSN
jgi:tetratricopeptide (TPR) repeat protein/predicted Ser/Thr protein kinase